MHPHGNQKVQLKLSQQNCSKTYKKFICKYFIFHLVSLTILYALLCSCSPLHTSNVTTGHVSINSRKLHFHSSLSTEQGEFRKVDEFNELKQCIICDHKHLCLFLKLLFKERIHFPSIFYDKPHNFSLKTISQTFIYIYKYVIMLHM